MKKLVLVMMMMIFGIMIQGCKTLDVVKQVPEQNIKSFAEDIDTVTLNAKMKDGTVYYIDTFEAYDTKQFVLWKQSGNQKINIGTLDIINFGITGQKKPYPEVVTGSGITINK